MSLPVRHDPASFRRTAAADLRFISASQFASMELSSLSSKSLSLSASKTLRDLMHKTAAEDDADDKFKLSIPPHPPREPRFVLAFSNLTYSVRLQGKMRLPIPFFRKNNADRSSDSNTKVLLNDISGVAREGEIMAVLGASGSGKSTLIDALADRIESSSLKGTIKLNDDVLDSKLSKVISAYVMQDDLLFPMLSVEETLMYSAEFRLPRSVTKSKKKERVAALISQLGLQNAAKTMIGDEGRRGVSGGERRRVSIGIDIIHDPIVLFLDEPTSGLDSTSAYMVVKVLQRIAKSGSVVIMSIHQPSYRILDLLDQTIFLSRGKTVYSGSPSNLSIFLSEFGHPVPENENRTEFTLDLIREMEDTIDGTNRLVEFNKSWNDKNPNKNKLRTVAKFTLKEAISQSISKGKLVFGAANSDSTNPASFFPTFANPMWMEMLIISDRSMRNARRIPEMFTTRLGAIVITGLILATMFWKLDDSPRGVQERIGFMAFAMSTTFYTCAEAIPTFLQERYIFMRETAYNAYRRSSYVVSQTITTFPTLVLLSLTFTIITFPSIGLSGGFSGFIFFFLTILSAFWVGNSFVTFLSGIISHEMIGFAVVIANLSYFLLFSGFFITRDRIPTYWLWFHYASLIKYPFEAIVQNEFDDPLKCFVSGFQMFDSTPLGKASAEVKERILSNWSLTLGGNVTGSSCVTTGHDVLVQRGVLDINKWNCLLVCVGLGFFFRILFYWALMFGSKNKRG